MFLITRKDALIRILVIFMIAVVGIFPAYGEPIRGEAIVLVNSQSNFYSDFERYIQPYLFNVGIPHILLDISSAQIESYIGNYSVIIIGHRQLDINLNYLSTVEQAHITTAVDNGTGFVNFDNYLFGQNNAPLYQFIQNIFAFGYAGSQTGYFITFDASHFITQNHDSESIDTESMTLAGISLPSHVTKIASCGTQPFLVVANRGRGRAVQWGTYDWMSLSVKGPLYGLDDLVWRSIVWAAHKPFLIKGFPNFVTMRVDDVSGPLSWVEEVNRFGLKPWLGLFINDIDDNEAALLSSIIRSGLATASIHAFESENYFYYNHRHSTSWSDSVMASYFEQGTQWHVARNIPISSYIVPHYYEYGDNVYEGLYNWGVRFIGTVINPGRLYGDPWIRGGPYRIYEPPQSSSGSVPLHYNHPISIPNSQYNGQFFNCLTEIRDETGYEWFPDNDVHNTVGRATRQLKRALDSMTLATLFTHEPYITNISTGNWTTILNSLTQNIASYNPIYVTIDYACEYLRALYTTSIESSIYDPLYQRVDITLFGLASVPVHLHMFTEVAGTIITNAIDIPAFSGSTSVSYFTGAGSAETVSAPAMPSGPASGTTGSSLSYTTGGSSSNLGHTVEYQFDWYGDGMTDLSAWGASTRAKSWTAAGTYAVRARSRCVTHPTVVSGWSSGLSVTITAAGYLIVSPIDPYLASGIIGGPFVPSSKNYSLQNTGSGTIQWAASHVQTWLTLSSIGGTLAPGASTTVTASINSNANTLKQGTYTDTISFVNVTDNNGNTQRRVSLKINRR